MSFLDRIATVRRWDPDAYRPFMIEDTTLGRVRNDFAPRLRDFPAAFVVSDRAVSLPPELADFAARSAAVHEAMLKLRDAGDLPRWRDEFYPVVVRWGDEPWMKLERAAVPLFGVRGFGVHLHGFVRESDGSLKMWVGKRAKDKATAPGKLDHLVAGGQPYGLGVRDNLIKECAEEAAVPPELAARAIAVGAVSYRCERDEGLRDDVLFVYDLELPAAFQPVNTDGELEWFQLWPFADVLARVRDSDDFKFNVALAIIDFAVRHGVLTPDEPDYQAIVEGLRFPELEWA